MKKTLIAAAVLSMTGAAFAQTPTSQPGGTTAVTLFGGLDARVNQISATNAGKLTRLDNSGEFSSRIGFRGGEDLGGGWSAAFWLEAGVGNDDGRGQNSTSNSTNMGQNLSIGSGNVTSATTTPTTQFVTPSASGLGGLQGLTFNRASTISLINKDMGEIRLGRDYTPSFWNTTVFDPFGTLGVGSSLNVTLGTLNPAGASIAPPGTAKPQIRTSNSLGWLSPNWNGFRAQVQYAFSEVPTNCLGLVTVAAGQSTSNSCAAADGDGKYMGLRVSYAAGPLSVAASTGTTSYSATIPAAALAGINLGLWANPGGNSPFIGDYKVTNFGGNYNFGPVRLWAQYGEQVQAASTGITLNTAGTAYTANASVTPEAKLTHYLLGATMPMGAWTHKFSYNDGKRTGGGVANDRTQKQYAIGTVYGLSKRTFVYASYSSLTASGVGATASQGLTSTAVTATSGDVKSTGFDLGINHRF